VAATKGSPAPRGIQRGVRAVVIDEAMRDAAAVDITSGNFAQRAVRAVVIGRPRVWRETPGDPVRRRVELLQSRSDDRFAHDDMV
jgi:hypothetical protein